MRSCRVRSVGLAVIALVFWSRWWMLTPESVSPVRAKISSKAWENEDLQECFHHPLLHHNASTIFFWLSRLSSTSNLEDCDLPLFRPNATTTLLVLGDSLDRNMIQDVCQWFGGNEKYLFPRVRPKLCTFTLPREGSTFSSTRVQILYLNIFGMLRTCGVVPANLDPRPYNTTVERLEAWWPKLQFLLPDPQQVRIDQVLVGSNHWDLSVGCTDQPRVSSSYKNDYRQGMHLLRESLMNVLAPKRTSSQSIPRVLWRTAPPVSFWYSQESAAEGHGRTQANQKVLNQLLQEEATKVWGDGVVDWWELIHVGLKTGETQILDNELAKDGRHYSKCPNLAFFDAWFQAIHQQRGS